MYIRFILSILLIVLYSFNSIAYADHVDFALNYADKKQWDKAIKEADLSKDPVVRKMVFSKQFLDIGNKNNDFVEIISFIDNNPNWPTIDKLKEAAEANLSKATNKKAIIKWFSKNHPKTSQGHKFYALAVMEAENLDPLKRGKIIKSGWIYGNFAPEEARGFLAKNKAIITNADHVKKIDFLLWSDQRILARNLASSLGSKEKAVFNAHIAFLDKKSNKNDLYKKLPEEYKYNSGLLYSYLDQYRKDDIIPISVAGSILKAPYDPMYHKDWWKLKNIFAKNMLNQKQYSLAYKIAHNHVGHCNTDKSESEWLAGWIALRFLHNPKLAYSHFQKMHNIVVRPITIARASYWLGVTAAALKDHELSHKWFVEAAAFNFTFYGQIALLEMKKTAFNLPTPPKITKEDRIYYSKNELARATNILIEHGRIDSALLYAKAAISTAKNYGEAALIVSSVRNSTNRNYIIELSKVAAQKGFLMIVDNNPTPYKIPKTSIEPSLTYAIILKESLFQANAISYANAHGLMQLIPETGCRMQKKLNTKCNVKRLTSDPLHNISLGNKYLEELLTRFDGSYILAAAAYNAGEAPVQRWIEKNGDPRKLKHVHQVIHWIESIPYYDTRDYVQRVLETIQIYREVLYHKSTLTIKKDLFRGAKK